MEMVVSCAIAFVITMVAGWLLIPALRRLKAGQSIREDGPKWHIGKQGTPTMGGLMFIIGIGFSVFLVGFPLMTEGSYLHLYVFSFAAIFGVIGYIDDYKKVTKHQNEGLTALQKFVLQLAAAVAFLTLMRVEGMLTPKLYVPFFQMQIQLHWVIYLIFAAFVIVGTVNAVNITDGVDGLVSSVSVPVAVFFACCAASWGSDYMELGIVAGGLLGGLLAFLFYNFHPAKVFMGDTGSLFLGGCIVALAFAFDMPLILILSGIIYLLEALSDIIQVIYFKSTGGKRLFKMAPLHHHFEMCGWSEVKIVIIFTVVSTLCCALALFGVMNRFAV